MTVVTSSPSIPSANGAGAPGAADDARIPLVVDVDGTMVRGDLFWEGVASMLLRAPHCLPRVLGALPRGRAAVKAAVAGHVPLEPDYLPYTPEVMALVEEAHARGRPVVVASGSDRAYVVPLAERIGAEAVLAPETGDGARVNLTGRRKLAALQARFPAFDYVGDARVDLPLWEAARTAYIVNPKPSTLRALAATGRAYTQLTPARRTGRELVRALRPHQWAKNALLFAPALTAHLTWGAGLVLRLLLGFVAFSLAASSIYLVNDLADLPHDRRHPRKRRRPLAAGTLPVTTALGAVPVLLGVALACALALPGAFAPTLAAYVVLSVAYSFFLKRRLLVDVVVLSMLYSVRVIGGGEIADVTLSRWFVAFALLLFFGLAAVKRVVELRDLAVRTEGGLAAALAAPPSRDGRLSGRAYAPIDWLPLTAMGSAASVASCVVYCLYVASPGVETLYARPDLLVAGAPPSALLAGAGVDLHDSRVAARRPDRLRAARPGELGGGGAAGRVRVARRVTSARTRPAPSLVERRRAVDRRVTGWLAATLALALGGGALTVALLVGAHRERPSGALAATALGETLRLAGPQASDSWWPMLHALNAWRAHPGRDLYAVFFTEHTKFQYPPASLLPFDALPRALTAPGPEPVPPPLARGLAWVSRAAVAATALLTWVLLELRLRRAGAADPLAGSEHERPHATRRGAAARLALVAGLTLAYYALLRGYTLGQVQVLLDAGVAGALVLVALGREGAAGAVLGACALVKPQYALVLLWGLLRRRARFAALCGAVLAAGTGLGVLRFGLQSHLSYLALLRVLSRHGEAFWPNQSVNGVMNRWLGTADGREFDLHGFPPYRPAVYAATLVSSALFLIVAFAGRVRAQPSGGLRPPGPRPATDQATVDLSVVIAAATMTSPIAWEHHYGTFLTLLVGAVPALAVHRPLGRATLPLAAGSYVAMACVLQRPYTLLATRVRGLAASHLFAGAVGVFVLLVAQRAWLRAAGPAR